MPYFAVDDQITFHPKAVAAGNAAMGAWTRAGAWAKNHATGGFVPAEVAHAIGAREAKRLVQVGFWETGEHDEYGAGYWFHDWQHIAGNFDGATEKAKRDAKREADRNRQRQKRERDSDIGASHAVTPPRISSPSVPSPSPDDVTTLSPVPLEIPASEGMTDEDMKLELAARNIRDIRRVQIAAERVVGPVPHVAMLLDLVSAVDRLATKPIKSVEAYMETTCLNSPEEIERAWRVITDDWENAVAARKAVAS